MIFQNNSIGDEERIINKLENDLCEPHIMYTETMEVIDLMLNENSMTVEDKVIMLRYFIDILLDAIIADHAAMFLSYDYISLRSDTLQGTINRPFWIFDPVGQNECEQYEVSTNGKRILSLPTEPKNIVALIKKFRSSSTNVSLPEAIYIPYLDLIISYRDGNNRLSTARYCNTNTIVKVFEYPLKKKFLSVFTDGRYWYNIHPRNALSYVADFRAAIIYTLSKELYYYEKSLADDYLGYDGFVRKNDRLYFSVKKLRRIIDHLYKGTEYASLSANEPELFIRSSSKRKTAKIKYALNSSQKRD